MESTILQIPISDTARSIIGRLHDSGYAAFVAGGSVRDSILKRPVKDVDIVTDAEPDDVARLFPHHVPDGKGQGVIKAIMDDNSVVDIATMRMDGDYTDGRRPDQVAFTKHLTEDV